MKCCYLRFSQDSQNVVQGVAYFKKIMLDYKNTILDSVLMIKSVLKIILSNIPFVPSLLFSSLVLVKFCSSSKNKIIINYKMNSQNT